MTIEVAVSCPRCADSLARAPHEQPWCPACEWNLDQVATEDEKRRTAFHRRRAFRANRRLLEELHGVLPRRPIVARGTVLRLAVAAVLLFALDIAMLVGGCRLVLDGAGLLWIAGVILVLLAIECRPRFPRIDVSYGRLTRNDAPNLWNVVDEAGRAIHAPFIDVLVLTDDFNAFCGRSGLRRRTVLGIGLPLWTALTPAGRSAVLGHEFGHLVNGDPTSAFLTQPALVTLARLSRIFQPRRFFGNARPGLEGLAAPVVWILLWPLYVLCRSGQTYLARVASRDHQRAEAFADALAVTLGGSNGAAELTDVLLFQDTVQTAQIRAAIAGPVDPSVLQERVQQALAQVRPTGRHAEQRSLRQEASPYANHPPLGLRRRLVAGWPATDARLSLPDSAWTAADAELAGRYGALRRRLVNTPLRR